MIGRYNTLQEMKDMGGEGEKLLVEKNDDASKTKGRKKRKRRKKTNYCLYL